MHPIPIPIPIYRRYFYSRYNDTFKESDEDEPLSTLSCNSLKQEVESPDAPATTVPIHQQPGPNSGVTDQSPNEQDGFMTSVQKKSHLMKVRKACTVVFFCDGCGRQQYYATWVRQRLKSPDYDPVINPSYMYVVNCDPAYDASEKCVTSEDWRLYGLSPDLRGGGVAFREQQGLFILNMFSKTYKIKLVDEVIYEVTGKLVTRGVGDIKIEGFYPSAAEEDDEGTDEAVEYSVVIVLNHSLVERYVFGNKKSYTLYLHKWNSERYA